MQREGERFENVLLPPSHPLLHVQKNETMLKDSFQNDGDRPIGLFKNGVIKDYHIRS